MVDTPLAVVVGKNDPQGWLEQEADHVSCERFEVVALNNRLCPAPAVADVGVIVTITGDDLPHPNSAMIRERQSNTCRRKARELDFINHPSPKAVIRVTVVGCGTLVSRE